MKKLEGDLCISRPASRLKWGIPFPESFGAGFVTYVWFDALVNYITYAPGHDPHFRERGAGEKTEFAAWWPPLHVIGKDILIPAHGVYWPIMLKALGFSDAEMPALLVHGWWNIAGAKMSKSIGNIVDPDALADKYGAEAVRYYLMSDIATGRDADFSEERLVQKYNVDLANSLGNLLNRTLSMAAKYREGILKTDIEFSKHLDVFMRKEQLPSTPSETLERPEFLPILDHVAVVINSIGSFPREFEDCATQSALGLTINIATSCNTLVDRTAPWKLAKQASDAQTLDTVLHTLAESLRIIAILISPVLPKAAAGIFAQLNWTGPMTLEAAKWGGLPDGHQLGKPIPLFPRIEAAEKA